MNKLDWITKKLIFLMGKGGVGKTILSRAVAHFLAGGKKKVLLVHVEQLQKQPQRIEPMSPGLWEITLNPKDCFNEYIKQKLKVKALYSLLLNNKLFQYFEKAAPGVRQMVMTGKIWFERNHFDHIVVDMPSSGYALTMLYAPFNFAKLFPGGPVHNDAVAITLGLNSANESALVLVSLAEEMSLQESIELAQKLQEKLPANKPWLILNRLIQIDLEDEKTFARYEKNITVNQSREFQALKFLKLRQSTQNELLKKFETEAKSLFCHSNWLKIDELSDQKQLEVALELPV